MVHKKQDIAIIGNLYSNPSSEAFLKKFINVVKEVGREVLVISADPPPMYNNTVWLRVKLKPDQNIAKRLFKYIKSQLKITLIILKKIDKFKITIVLVPPFVIPVILLRLANKRVLMFVAQKHDSLTQNLLSRLSFLFSDFLIVESENVINSWKIKGKGHKILNGTLYVDTNFFKDWEKINDRERIVGYIGGLERRKGVIDLIKAITILNSSGENIKYIIGGVGRLEISIKTSIRHFDNIEFKGYIDKKELPGVLNKLKLLVLPSYSEGLPNVILEAMACGTPVLASPVGAIPNIIKDSENGFIIENHSPECIAKNIKKVLNHSDLERISENARGLINEKFTYEDAVRRYNKIVNLS